MAGKKNRKRSKKNKIHPGRFAYDIWSFILSLCAFPKEKMIYEEKEKNSYKDDKCVCRVAAVVMTLSLYYRDEWKTMFESRSKASGFDTVGKIENYLTSLLAVNRQYRLNKAPVKVRMSLSVYSEILLFLNYKGIDFDFRQLVNSWRRHFREHIALNSSATDEILDNLYDPGVDITDYIKWVTTFMQNIASPYGSRDDISTLYRKETETRTKVKQEESLQLARTMAKEPETSLAADFQSLSVLPGDRESPEPTLNIECGAVGGKELSEGESTRSTGVAECRSGKFPTELPSGSEKSISLISDHEPPKSQMRVDEGGDGSQKESRVRNRRRSVAEYRFEEIPSPLSGDRESSELTLNIVSGAVGGKEVSERERTLSAAIGEFPTLLGSETSISLPGDREATTQQLRLDEHDVGSRKESRVRSRRRSVAEYRFGEMASSSSGDPKSHKPQLNLECGDVGEKEASERELTMATGVETCRSGERQISKASLEIEIEEKLALMDLSSLPEDRDLKSNKRKPKN